MKITVCLFRIKLATFHIHLGVKKICCEFKFRIRWMHTRRWLEIKLGTLEKGLCQTQKRMATKNEHFNFNMACKNTVKARLRLKTKAIEALDSTISRITVITLHWKRYHHFNFISFLNETKQNKATLWRVACHMLRGKG